LFLIAGGVAALAGAALSRHFAASLSLPHLLGAGFLSLAVGIGLLAFSTGTPALLASAALSGLPSGIIGPLAASIYQKRPPRALRADMQALSGALVFASAPIAVLAAGIALDTLPAESTLLSCAALLALGALIVMVALPSVSVETAMHGQVAASASSDPVTHDVAAPAHPGGRSVEIDALRGLALFGIIIVNAPFFAGPLKGLPMGGWLDWFAVWLTGAFFAGKFFLIFSFLFGFGFAILLIRAERDTSKLRGKFMRRLLIWACVVYLLGIALQTLALMDALEQIATSAPSRLVLSAGYLGGFLDVAAARIAELPDSLGFIAAFNGLPALAMFLTGLAELC
jgi:hypothetical protein